MAVRYGWITVNPMDQVVKTRALRRQPDPPSSAEAARLVVAAFDQDDEWGVLVWLGMVTGMRAAASSPRCVGGTSTATRNRRTASRIRGRGRRRWHKDTKTHKMRRITLDVETIALLAEHRERCAGVLAEGRSELAGDHFVFSADPARQKPRNPDSISNRYRRMAENLGIDTHIHALRHYSATELLSSDVDLRTVARTARPRRRPNVDQATYQVQLTAIGESDVRQFVRDFYPHNDMSRDMSPKQCLSPACR
jgi:integrase